MAVRSLTLTVEAYRELVAIKRNGESYSELILRLTRSQPSLTAFAGAWRDAPRRKLDEVRRYLEGEYPRTRVGPRRVARRSAAPLRSDRRRLRRPRARAG